MEKLHTKNINTTTVINADGEIIEEAVAKTTFLTKSKEEFYLMYSGMITLLKGSVDAKVKLLASLLERYPKGQEFSLNNALKMKIATEVNLSVRTVSVALTKLKKDNILVTVGKNLYTINPRYAFQGSTHSRNARLKVILELHCKDC